MLQARAADRPHGPGSCSPPQCWSEGEGGDAAERRPTGERRPPPGPGRRVEHATHYAAHGHRRLHLRSARPGILAEPGPQRSDRSRRHSSGDNLPTLALPVLAGSAGEAVDASSLRYLSAAARLDQSRQRLQQLREEQQAWDNRPSRRKEKRRKKKLPRGRFFRCRARRRQRQWHVSGSPGVVLLRAVGRPEMPCIHGRYGPEGQLQWHGQCWYCW